MAKDYIDRIRALTKQKGWNFHRLAKESGIPYTSIRAMVAKNTTPKIDTAVKLCNALQVDLIEFVNDEAIVVKNTKELTTEEQKLIAQYRKMNRTQKDFINVYAQGLLQMPMIEEEKEKAPEREEDIWAQ